MTADGVGTLARQMRTSHMRMRLEMLSSFSPSVEQSDPFEAIKTLGSAGSAPESCQPNEDVEKVHFQL